MSAYRSAVVVSLLAASSIDAQQVRPYRPAFDALDYALTIELPANAMYVILQ